MTACIQQEISQLSNTVFQLEQQMMMLEGVNMQTATVNAMKAGNDAMKKQMKEINVDSVQVQAFCATFRPLSGHPRPFYGRCMVTSGQLRFYH